MPQITSLLINVSGKLMHTRTVLIAELPKLLLDMVRQQFVGDIRINVQVMDSVSIEGLLECEHIDILMLPQIYNNKQSVMAFLHRHPCSRVLFVGEDNESLEIIELRIEQRKLEAMTTNTMRELFYSSPELCPSNLSPQGLN